MDSLHVNRLFTAMTRPPMLFHVTANYALAALMLSMCAMILFGRGNLFYLAVTYLPLHSIGVIGCLHDVNWFSIIDKKMDCRPVPNKKYWGCKNYVPY